MNLAIPAILAALALLASRNRFPTRGVNLASPKLQDRVLSYPPFNYHPPPIADRMADCKIKGLQLIRCPIYWEAFVKDPSGFVAALQEYATAADAHGLKVDYVFLQWNTGSQFTGTFGRGGGFPPQYTEKYSTQDDAWAAFYDNIDNVQQGLLSFWVQVVNVVDRNVSTWGYELLNEPHVYLVDQYQKLGDCYSYLVQGLSQNTKKPLFFSKCEPKDPNMLYLDMRYDPLTRPKSGNVIWSVHMYGKTDAASIGSFLDSFQKLAAIWNVPMVITEWGVLDSASAALNVQAMRARGLSWMRWVYDALDQYALTLGQSTIVDSPQMAFVTSAMAAYP